MSTPTTRPMRTPIRRLLAMVATGVPNAAGRLTLATLLSFMASAASVALMGVSAWLLSRAAEHPPVLYLEVGAIAVRAFGISRGAFRYVERLVGHDVALRMQSVLRVETYRHLAETTLLGARSGDLLARIIADVEAVQDLIVRVWIPFTSAALVLTATSTALAFFSPASAAWLLGSSLVAGILVPWLARTASAAADARAVPVRGRLADVVHEISRTATDLVAYGRDEAWLDRFAAVDEDLRSSEARTAWVRGVATAAQVLAAGTAVVAALAIGSSHVAAGTLPPVMIAVLVLTPLALHEAMSALTQAAQTYTRARTALGRVSEVLEAPPVGNGDVNQAVEPAAAGSLLIDDLSVGWPDHDVLIRHLSVSITAGEKVALVGPSGVGKTTVAATILGLIPPVSGSVEVHERLGYLAQDAHIFATTVAENVRLGNRDATDADIVVALNRAGLAAMDPHRMIGELGATLSGGEARRVAMARLLVGNAQVLILDEPSEHLDVDTATQLLDDIWSSTGSAAVLVITHDPAVVARCDRSVRLADYAV